MERSALVVVGIGASAGGLEVYEQFFDGMPPDSGAGFVVVQHLAPDHASILAELLSKHTAMPVAQVEADVRVEPNHVYLIPPNRTLTLLDGRLRLAEASEAPRVPIDGFFVSLAGELGERAVGVILSGSGSDGALGMQAIKEHGGMTMVQTPESARFDSMPRSAIDTGHVDHVLTVQEMPAALTAHLRLLGVAGASGGLDWTELIAAACEILHQQTGHDFGRYKEATLRRRIARRMDVLGLASAAEYVARLREDTVEGGRLLAELLINVTQFFRDPDVFERLGQEIVPKLCEGKTKGDAVRVWVPGCSSGEEAYSIAILLLEHLETFESPPDVKIFATDIDEEALATARRGRYPEAIAEHVSAARLERFFVKVGSAYQVKKALRAICFFTTHNLVNHPPFSQLDLISCRNTLIYLRSDLQDELLALLHYGLRPGGYLLLGPAESVTARPELFRPVLERQRIFQRREPLIPPVIHFPLGEPSQAGMAPSPSAGQARYSTRGFERLLLERYVPASAIIDERGEILYLAGPVGRYLSPPPGRPTHNLFDLAARDLRAGLRDAVQETLATRHGVVRPGLLAEAPDGVRTVDVSVRRMPELGSDAKVLLVAFEDRGPPVAGAPPGESPASDEPVATRLERELQLTRARLQTTLDDQQASAEQFQTANEELLSMNEELQSTNEELQTSREELQSTNEELSTLTDELRRRIGESDAAANDLRNLFESTHIATIFLDVAMCIKRFTPAAAELFRVRESDLGRPVSEVMPRFTGGDLTAAAREVLRTLEACEREVHRDEDDRWYVLRLQPYRTVENEIAGVVVTFVDITERKRTADLLVQADHRKDEFLAMLAHELRNPLAPVRNAVHLLGQLAADDRGQAWAREVIERQVGHMARIIDDLLDVSRISQHKMLLRRERVDLVALVRTAGEDARPTMAERSLTFEVTLPDAPRVVLGDATRLSQIVGNLLNNACKFTDPGGSIRMTLDAPPEAKEAVLVVEDTGIGMDPGILSRLFDIFSQADHSLERSRGGLGLGLSLVKGLAEAHGGSVRAESDGPGRGARLTVTLPLDASPAAPERDARSEPSPKPKPTARSVLVIEDNADAAETTQALLELEGHQVAVASNGADALATAKQSRPDIVLCDIGLAGAMDGYAVAKVFRATPELRNTYLVAVSGYGTEQDVRSARDAGFDAHLTKPVLPERLAEVVANLHA